MCQYIVKALRIVLHAPVLFIPCKSKKEKCCEDDHSCDNGFVEKKPVAWKEYCAGYWFKELQESMDRCTGRRDITEIC